MASMDIQGDLIDAGLAMKIVLESPEAWQTLQAQIERHGGAMVHTDDRPAPFTDISVTFALKTGEIATATGQAVHFSDDGHVALTFTGQERQKLVDAKARTKGRSPRRGSATSPLAEGDEGGAAWKRYESLNKNEKLRLARYGNANERRLVLRDKDISLHLHVLNNPGISGNEVASILRAGASSQVIRRITERSDLMGNAAVIDALVHSPLTPIGTAIALVGRLPLQTARRIAKSGNLRTQVVAAARKRVIKR